MRLHSVLLYCSAAQPPPGCQAHPGNSALVAVHAPHMLRTLHVRPKLFLAHGRPSPLPSLACPCLATSHPLVTAPPITLCLSCIPQICAGWVGKCKPVMASTEAQEQRQKSTRRTACRRAAAALGSS